MGNDTATDTRTAGADDAKHELVVVANRLPVRRSGDEWTVSPGGLVRALGPVLQSAVYCGVPAANAAFGVAQRVLAEPTTP